MNNYFMKYSKENMIKAVLESKSITEVAISFGLKPSGGNRSNLNKKIKECQIDVSHFTKEKYTKELLESVVIDSVSILEVIQKLGKKPGGGTHGFIKRKIKNFEIDTSHFQGQKANSGLRHKGYKGRSYQEVLIKREKGSRETAYILRRALIESGREHRCEGVGCTITDNWCGKPIQLHVHHKNGNWLDNEKENLEFCCPNCHSQTNNYCSKNNRKE